MPVPTLQHMITRACIRNVQQIQDVGDMQYELVAPILRKIENPQQLREIEANSPAIADSTEQLWRQFIKRDIPNWEQKILEPKNPRSWWKVYRKLARDEQRAKDEIEARLQAAMADIEEKRGAGKTRFEAVVHKLPATKKAFVDGNPTNSRWNRGPSQAAMKRGHDIIKGLKKKSVNAPRGSFKPYVPSVGSQIKHAPISMVRDHARPPPLPEVKSRSAPVAKPKPLPPLLNSTTNRNSEREDRLRALTNPGSRRPTAPAARRSLSPSDDDLHTKSRSPVPAAKKSISKIRITREVTRTPAAPPSSPAKAINPARGDNSVGKLGAVAMPTQTSSPGPVLPTLVKKRPASSVFMPAKKRKA